MDQVALFFRLWVRFSFRHLLAHPWRTLAVLFGIGLGAAVFTSVRLASDASIGSFKVSVEALSGKAQWTLACPGGRVPEGIVTDLMRYPAVQTASPFLSTYVHPAGKAAEAFLLIGIDPILDRPLRAWRTGAADSPERSLPWLKLMTEPNTILLGEAVLQSPGPGSGDGIELAGPRGVKRLTVIGTLTSEGLGMVEGGRVAIADIATFQEFTGLAGFVDRIDLLFKPGATDKDVDAVRANLPRGAVLERPSESAESGEGMIRAYQLNLSVLSFVSLFVGMFLVYSLISLHATARRHEVAILRSIGSSSRMVFLLFFSEGLFFGIAGWLIAIPLSSFMVRHLLGGISSTISNLFVRVQVHDLTLDPWEVVLSFALTVLVALTAALQPACSVMAVPPRDALAARDAVAPQRTSPGRTGLLGLFLAAVSWPVSQYQGVSDVPVAGYLGTFLLFCGFSLTSPFILRLIGSHLPPVLRRLGGEPAFLAGRFIRDSGTRIAISVGALITAIALFVSLAIMIHSFRNTVQLWVDQSIRGDLYLRSAMADINRYRNHLPGEVTDRLRLLPGDADVLPYRRIYLRLGTVPYQFEALDLRIFFRHANLLLLDARLDEIAPALLDGKGVVVSEVFASRTGLNSGKRFRANIEGYDFDLPVLGVFRDYRTQGGGVIYYPFEHFADRTGDPSWSGASVYLQGSETAREEKAAQLRTRLLSDFPPERYALQMTLGSELRRAILRIFDETFAVTSVLLLIALIVAALGMTTTLTVLVLERTRQIHTITATGAGHGQIRAMIFWEALLMTLVGEVVGVGCGFALSHILIFVINRQSFGWTFLYGVDWFALAMSLPLILAASLLSAIPAAQLVFRQSPALVLREH